MEQDKQLSLLSDAQLEELTDTDAQQREYSAGIYTGVQLRANNPDHYDLICELLADGSLSQRQIARLTGHSRCLVSAIARSPDIRPLKKNIASRARNLAALCLERAEELIQSGAKVTIRDLGILAGIALEKSQLLDGEATSRIETVASAPGFDEFAEQVRRIRNAAGASCSPAPYDDTGAAGEKSAAKEQLPAPDQDRAEPPADDQEGAE